mmetsp:Transcript_17534/g.25583  ORF Transcript_17534/g.25583 Transcript_17534/m.25583 type:complete len:255 (+) Transcript_17534:126-890(+)|eukprot:CAMPEP_0197246814 /NCGR_PEP_ID=MMETSP1429-20130617/23480_1 /TAXON_ID=49237 /ORGANISM="Chaetoceros  sp., Strain UNC1202" /LENGTH=254 /DNA_ID=CAMNT_0042707573 /DNA_START=142 /DNA_END=906 /DNA_ORIENTATION=-
MDSDQNSKKRHRPHGIQQSGGYVKNRDRQLSKGLSWLLRHSAPKLNLTVSADGYVPLSAILSCDARNFNQYTEEDVRRVTESNDKQRFRLEKKSVIWETSGGHGKGYTFAENDGGEEVLCIRANQGHSIPGICFDRLLNLISSDELKDLTIVHGTFKNVWENYIKKEGLSRMSRNQIHFASGLPDGDGVISGMRRTCQVYIYIDGAACAEAGIQFYRSDNGVILTAGLEDGMLPCCYFERVIDAASGADLLEKE